MLGHLTGRLLLEREPYKVNQQAVIDACAETGTWIELNCNPYRFDLDWRLWPYAKSKGVKCVINPDAHRNEHAGFLRLGAGIARKGWLDESRCHQHPAPPRAPPGTAPKTKPSRTLVLSANYLR